MKIQMKLHLLYIVAIVLLASCENEIPYNPDNQQPLLIMNAQLDAGKDVNEVFLHLSKGSSIVRLNEATLTLFINNRIAETPQALTPEEIFGPPENYPEDAIFVYDAILYKLFRLNTPLHPGDNIRLEATAENGKYHASAEVTVPQPIESLHVDTCLAYLREYSGQTLYRQYRTTTGWTFGMTVVTIANGKNTWKMKTAASSKWKTRTALGIGPPYPETLPSLLPDRTKSSTGKMLY